jgi:hypothetical protein
MGQLTEQQATGVAEHADGQELRVLYVPDVAKILRISLSAAREFLAGLESRFEGDGVVRIGRKLAITEATLRRVLAGWAPDASLRRNVAALERRVQRFNKRLRTLEAMQASRLSGIA